MYLFFLIMKGKESVPVSLQRAVYEGKPVQGQKKICPCVVPATGAASASPGQVRARGAGMSDLWPEAVNREW